MNGEIKADGRLRDLEASTDVVLVLDEGLPEARSALLALAGVEALDVSDTVDGATYRLQTAGSSDLRPAIYGLARERGWPLKELRRDVRTLEAVFNDLAIAAGGEQA